LPRGENIDEQARSADPTTGWIGIFVKQTIGPDHGSAVSEIESGSIKEGPKFVIIVGQRQCVGVAQVDV
jgi:hypothetical protein